MRCITHTRRQSILCTPIHLDCLLQLFQSLPIISCPGDKFQLCLSYKFHPISNNLPNIYMNSNSDNDHFCLSCSVTEPLRNVHSIWSHLSSFTKKTTKYVHAEKHRKYPEATHCHIRKSAFLHLNYKKKIFSKFRNPFHTKICTQPKIH